MSHFYGSVQGNRGDATRGGSKASGFDTVAASWDGSIRVWLYHDEETGKDMYKVSQEPWRGHGISKPIAEGVLGE